MQSLSKKMKDLPIGKVLGLVVGTTAVGTGLVIGKRSFRTVPPGHVGYQNLFGNVDVKPYHPGYNFINPLASMVQIDLRDRRYDASSKVASKEGLMIEVDVAAICHLEQGKAHEVFVNVGERYQDVLLTPQMKSIIRDTVSGYEAKALYSEDSREEIRVQIMERLKHKAEPRGILVKDILINQIYLPRQLTNAIEDKLKAEQEMEKMNFIVDKERKEAERKTIEAEGIKKFQDIVAEGVSEALLRWKGITATEELAKSPNTKIIVIGGKDGLPLILNSGQK